jgi:hypothetical protein
MTELWRATHKHLKSGGLYRLLYDDVIIEATYGGDVMSQTVVIYEGYDGKRWMRPYAEFYDGRFEEITPAVPRHIGPTKADVAMATFLGKQLLNNDQ